MAKLNSKRIVLLISIFFPPEIGGGSTGAWNRALAFHKMGYSVFVLCGFPAYPTGKVKDKKYKGKIFYVENMSPFTVIRLRLIPLKHSGLVNRLLIFLNFIFAAILFMPKISKIVGRVDVVYARAPILFSSFIGSVYAKLRHSFFILEMPDLWPEELVAIKTNVFFIVMPIGRALAKLAYALPDTIVTISTSAANRISADYRPGVPVYGIPVGVDSSNFKSLQKNNARNELIKTNLFPSELTDKFIVLYTGIVSEAQKVENLAYAAEKLKHEKEIAIVIIGEGEQKKLLEQLKVEHNLQNFYLLPTQPRSLMPTIISSADVCAIMLSSEAIFQIALPTKFYEYLASKKPLIAVCEGELANVINSNNIGKALNHKEIDGLAETIKEFKESSSMLQTMQNNCEKVLQNFSIEKISSDLHKIIEKEIVVIE